MAMIRVAVNGSDGKMGLESVQAILAAPNLELVGEFNQQHDLSQEIPKSKAQVVVDFTTANVVFENTKKIIDAGAHPVIGTTGFTSEQIDELTTLSATLKRGGIIAPNFSVGALLMMKLSKECAQHFPHVEIIEMHHDNKVDAPSGTAVKTAELIAQNRTVPTQKVEEKIMIPGARGGVCENINVHSVRLPGLVAHQQVLFGGIGETLTIKHDTINRQAFMPGVVLACNKVIALNRLVYGLETLLFESD